MFQLLKKYENKKWNLTKKKRTMKSVHSVHGYFLTKQKITKKKIEEIKNGRSDW